MSEFSTWVNDSIAKKSFLNQLTINSIEEYKRQWKLTEKLQKAIEEFLASWMQDDQNKPVSNNILPDWKSVTVGDGFIEIKETKNELFLSKWIIDNLVSRFPRQEELIKSIIRPDIKIKSDVFVDIYNRLETVLLSIDLNSKPTIVHDKRNAGTQIISIADSNSKNLDVIELRKAVKELNDKYFNWKISPFNPILFN